MKREIGDMNCITAQSKIMPFINGELNDSDFLLWVDHIEHCSDCADELEVYYTLMIATQQLDTNQQLSLDFKGELHDLLMLRKEKLLNKKRRHRNMLRGIYIFSFILIAFIGIKVINYAKTHYYHAEEIPQTTISGEKNNGQ